ncbi:MAG: hypothetical protein OXQ92_10255 [Boseongicola sp.]|nr:hypothetical protein [Boseongicola sp.]MDD9978450.1 hypothetical protein [Boseongicola sp.]
MEMKTDNTVILNFNLLGVLVAYGMLAMSIWITDIPLSAKGYWGMGVLLLTLSLVNFVKYRFEEKIRQDRLRQLEDAKNEKLLEDYVNENVS